MVNVEGNPILGKKVRLIVRQPNGTISLYVGILVSDDATSFYLKLDDGRLRVEPKAITAVEVF